MTKKRKTGRPEIVINAKVCKQAENLSAQGLTMKQIANVMGMGEATLYEKQQKFPEFSEAIKKGRDKGVQAVTNALFRKAVQGDNTAIIFYLKNRAGWTDRVQTEHIGDQVNVNVNIQDKYAELEQRLDNRARAKSGSAKGTRKPQNSISTTLQ